MSDLLILPVASPVLDGPSPSYALDLRTGRDPRGRAAQRPRDPRVAMLGSGYRAHLDGRPAAIVNLSISGAQLRGSARVLPDQPAIVKIGWPLDHQMCLVLGRVRWVQFEPDARLDESLYRVGLAFETWDVRRLKEILRHLRRL